MSAAVEIARWAALVFCCLSLSALALTVALGLAAPVIAGRRAHSAARPPISFVLPIKAMEEAFVEAQTSVFEQDYPAFDVTVTAVETESEPISAVRRIIAAHPHVAAKLVRATATFAASPKVNNMYQAIEDAPHDLVVTKDSNIVLPPGAAAEAVACMGEGVGLVTAITEARGARNFAAEIECSLMNQSHGRFLYAASALGLGFGLGKLMVFRRSDLHRAGGFEAIAHSVGEDSAMDHALKGLGLRTVIMKTPIVQMLGARRIRDVANRQLRWSVIRRHNETPAFVAEPLGLSSCAAIAGAIAAPLFGWSAVTGAALVLGLWFACETLLALARGWDVSVTAPATMIARDAMMLGVWLRAWFTTRVVWAAEVYDAQKQSGPLPTPVASAPRRNDP